MLNFSKKILAGILSIFLLLAVCSFSPAYSANRSSSSLPYWNKQQGWYAEGLVGTVAYNMASIFPSSVEDRYDSGLKGFAWDVALGYMYGVHWGLEGGFTQYFLEASVTASNTSGSTTVQTWTNIESPYAAFRFNIPVGHRFAIIPKLGLEYLYSGKKTVTTQIGGQSATGTLSKISGVLPFMGIGASYAIRPNLSIVVQLQGMVLFPFAEFGIFGAGLDYYFG
jgi:hypothetical protein